MDSRAYHELIEQLPARGAGLRLLAAHVLGGSSEADDVVQEAWLRVLKTQRPSVRIGLGWMRGVVRNVARERLRASGRRQRREAQASPNQQASDASEVVARAEQMEILLRCLRELPEPYATTLARRYLDGMSSVQIGELTSTPPTTVRARCAKGLELLRHRLQGSNRRRGLALLLLPPTSVCVGAVSMHAQLLGVSLKIATKKKAMSLAGLVLLLFAGIVGLRMGEGVDGQTTQHVPMLAQVSAGDAGPAPSSADPVPQLDGTRTEGARVSSEPGPVAAATPVNWELVVAWDERDGAWSRNRTGGARVQFVSVDGERVLGAGRLKIVGSLGKLGELIERPWLEEEVVIPTTEAGRLILYRRPARSGWVPVHTSSIIQPPDSGRRRLEIRRSQLALPKGRVAGRLVRHDGTPAGGYEVRIDVQVAGLPEGEGAWQSKTRVSDAGEFSFANLPAEALCRLSANAPSSVRSDLGAHLDAIEVRPGEEELTLTLPQPDRGHFVRFRVVDESGKPLVLPNDRAYVTIVKSARSTMESARRFSFVVVGESADVQEKFDTLEQLLPEDDFWVDVVFRGHRCVDPVRVLWDAREERTVNIPVERIPPEDATALQLSLKPAGGRMPSSLTLVFGYGLSGNSLMTHPVLDGVVDLGSVPKGALVRIWVGNQLKPYHPDTNPWVEKEIVRDHVAEGERQTLEVRLERAGGVRIVYDDPAKAPATVVVSGSWKLIRTVDEGTGRVMFTSRPLPPGRVTLSAAAANGRSLWRKTVMIAPGVLVSP